MTSEPDPVLLSAAAHAIPGAEALDGGTCRRILTIDGEPALVTITLDPDGLRAAVDPALKDPEPTAAIIHRWFDLDADTTTSDRALAAHSTNSEVLYMVLDSSPPRQVTRNRQGPPETRDR